MSRLAIAQRSQQRKPISSTKETHDRIQRALSQRICLLDIQSVNHDDEAKDSKDAKEDKKQHSVAEQLPVCRIFGVQGTTGSYYQVTMDMDSVHCECMDYQQGHGRLCKTFDVSSHDESLGKHIYFLLIRVFRMTEEQVVAMTSDSQYTTIWNAALGHWLDHGDRNGVTSSTTSSEASERKQDKDKAEKLVVEGAATKKPTKKPKLERPWIGEECCICFEIMVKNDKTSHCAKECQQVFHRECLDMWIRRNPSCPHCRVAWK